MPCSYVSHYVHIVFGTKDRVHSIQEEMQPKLWVQDRTRAAEFSLAQGFLAQMLGIGRPTLNVVARSFEKVGHRRGRIRIFDRTGLRAMACVCYETTRQVFAQLYA